MKRIIAKLTGMLLMLILASNLSLNAQRGMRGHGEMMNHYGMRHDSIAEGRTGMRGPGHVGRGPGEHMLASIPNVTEKQKKDITDLQVKQQDEMKKFRDEMSSKMQSIRDSYKKSMMSILTDDQKKFIESKQQKATAPPSKTK